MKYIYLFLFLILCFTFSCKNREKSTDVEIIDSLAINATRISRSIGETLTPKAKKELENWKEYNDVDGFIIEFYNITISEALTKSEELEGLVKLMKDTIRVPLLDKPNVIARFNVLHNETMRLADMATISSITEDEVVYEVNQILDVYASVNSKINTIYKALDLQEALDIDTEAPIETEEDEKREGGMILKKAKTISSKKQ